MLVANMMDGDCKHRIIYTKNAIGIELNTQTENRPYFFFVGNRSQNIKTVKENQKNNNYNQNQQQRSIAFQCVNVYERNHSTKSRRGRGSQLID